MFRTIFKYEINFWLRQPSIYVYGAIFFFFSLIGMAGSAELFDPHTPVSSTVQWINSPAKINDMFVFWTKLILFLLPSIIGYSVYRDYKSRMFTLLYSYPILKSDYLLGKFLSAILILFVLVSGIGLGLAIGTQLPGLNQALLASFQWSAYWHSYLVYVLPNILIFGALVFAAVILSRNNYVGFILIILLFLIQGLVANLLGGMDQQLVLAILDPFGASAAQYQTRFWTTSDWNNNSLALDQAVILNRLLWLTISVLTFILAWNKFELQHEAPLSRNKKSSHRSQKSKTPGYIQKVKLPEVNYKYSFINRLRSIRELSKDDFSYILNNRAFISIVIIGLLFVFFQQMQMNPPYGVKTLPVTWKLLRIPGTIFSGVIMVLTFLFAGMLIHRDRIARMNQLVDVCAVPNWVLLLSKLVALIKMQVFLLTFILIGGLTTQFIHGFYQIQLGHYLFELYILNLINFIIWALVALFIQSLFSNPYLGLFLLILGALGMSGLPEFGIEAAVFCYNMGPSYEFSDLEGYGLSLGPYLAYKLYWLLFGIFLLFGTYCWWVRGLTDNFSARFRQALSRVKGTVAWAMFGILLIFLVCGFKIYQADTGLADQITTEEEEAYWRAENEKRYKQYESMAQPRIVDITINLDLYPKQQTFNSTGQYLMINRSNQAIDTLLINYSFKEKTDYKFESAFQLLNRDTQLRFDIVKLEESLLPDDSLEMNFTLTSPESHFFHPQQRVRKNGTFFYNNLFPGLGYRNIDIINANQRAKFGLAKRKQVKSLPRDSTALQNSYTSDDSDWLHLETIISTDSSQIAIAPGYEQRSWVEGDRRYFHYKMDSPIKDYYGFNAGSFELRKDSWQDVSLEIYYHPEHTYNLDRMMAGLKGALEYNSHYFSPYQHRQARIIEFPITLGKHGTTFANSIPMSEIYFVSDVDDADPESIDLPFYVTAHEMAHQWWGNQLIPADVLGAKLLTESLAEYTALRVSQSVLGEEKLQQFLKLDRHLYLSGRSKDSHPEMPLVYSFPDQHYINYRKGALALYALSEYIGEERMNAAIKSYLDEVKFQDAPYTTSLELLDHLRKATPDSLQYLIQDYFETITFYDNQILAANAKKISEKQYELEVKLKVSKYRCDGDGNKLQEKTTLMADYIELLVYGADEASIIDRRMHKITSEAPTIKMSLTEQPLKIAIDPYLKLMDTDLTDNHQNINLK
jgi:ABC-2 type transport system permease protein